MTEKWGEARGKLQESFKSSEWWTTEHWAPIYNNNPRVCLWLVHCVYNKLTKRFHIPCKKNGVINTFLYDQLRKREYDITWCLNGIHNERRGGFFDTAWTDERPDFWLVCDGYMEVIDMPSGSHVPQPPINRVHSPTDTYIFEWSDSSNQYELMAYEY